MVANWAIGSVYNSYLYGDQKDDVWEKTMEINDNAIISPLFGFAPDVKPVNVQLSNCQTVIKEYTPTLATGISDNYDEFMKKLKDAGVDELQAEMQKQIDEWYAAKSK